MKKAMVVNASIIILWTVTLKIRPRKKAIAPNLYVNILEYVLASFQVSVFCIDFLIRYPYNLLISFGGYLEVK